MSMTDQFSTWEIQLKDAIKHNSLPLMALGLSDAIEESARNRVYSYEASDEAMEARRYMLGDRSNLSVTINDMDLEIQNVTEMQSGEPGETEWVEKGIRQGGAGARPFMEEALKDYVDSGKAAADLADGLRQAGFDVN